MAYVQIILWGNDNGSHWNGNVENDIGAKAKQRREADALISLQEIAPSCGARGSHVVGMELKIDLPGELVDFAEPLRDDIEEEAASGTTFMRREPHQIGWQQIVVPREGPS